MRTLDQSPADAVACYHLAGFTFTPASTGTAIELHACTEACMYIYVYSCIVHPKMVIPKTATIFD